MVISHFPYIYAIFTLFRSVAAVTERKKARASSFPASLSLQFSKRVIAMARSPLVIVFGVLGNIASFVCFLAPLPTFIRVCKKKSTEGFQSLPYVAALFGATLWIFYAYIKTGEFLIITINSFGCVIETIYLAIYIAYSPKKARINTIKLMLLLNFGGLCIVVILTHVLAKEPAARLKLLGWICVVLSTSVFAAPLSIIRVVIRTKSVEYMPVTLSLLLTISAVMWLCYGMFLGDIYVTLPNIVGVTFGTIQIVLYLIYKNCKPVVNQKVPELKADIENAVVAIESAHAKPAGDIEIGEKKEEKQEPPEKKPQDQNQVVAIAHDQTDRNMNIIDNCSNKGEVGFIQGPKEISCQA